ncbi:MAG: histidine phosphatase family protein, partial [Acidimicrobiales bacterium]
AHADWGQPAHADWGQPVLILLRHGQTEANASGLYQGRSDRALTGAGEAQARAAALVLAGVARVVSSPLLRATQTAEALGLGVAVEIDQRWIEMDYGRLDGQPVNSPEPEELDRWRGDVDYAPGGGESLAVVGARVRSACSDLAEEAAHCDVLVVSHVSPIKAAVAWALGAGDEAAWRMFLGVAAICRVNTSGPVPSLVSFNERGHLSGS